MRCKGSAFPTGVCDRWSGAASIRWRSSGFAGGSWTRNLNLAGDAAASLAFRIRVEIAAMTSHSGYRDVTPIAQVDRMWRSVGQWIAQTLAAPLAAIRPIVVNIPRQPTHHDSGLTSQGLPGARPGAVGLKNGNVIRPTYAFLQRWDWDAGLPQGSAAGICVQVQPDTPRVDRSG